MRPQASVAGLMGKSFPRLQIDSRARDGAKFAELPAQLDGEERFDMLLGMAGGNDVSTCCESQPTTRL